MKNCAICADRATRDLVDGALTSGQRPAEVYANYGEGRFSRSSLYRHAQHRSVTTLTVNYLGDRSTGDVIADTANLTHALYGQYREAAAAGNTAAAARFGHEALAGFQALQRAGVFSEAEAMERRSLDAYIDVLNNFMFLHRDSLTEFARIAHELGHRAIADDITNDLPAVFAGFDKEYA